MGFLTGLVKSAIGVVTSPIAVVKDVIDVTQGEEPVNTSNQLGGAISDFVESIEDLADGEII